MSATAGISYYLENSFINHVFRNTSMTSGSNTWVALYTSNPTKGDTGTEVASTNGYARAFIKSIESDASPWLIESNHAYNNHRITFPSPTGSWGTITHWGLRDAPTGGNLYFYGPITSGSFLIETGNDVYVTPNSLDIYYYVGIYLSDKLLGHALNNVSYSSPGSSIYGALYFLTTSSDGVGEEEVSGSGYGRQQMINWITPTSGSTYNISGSTVFCSDASANWEREIRWMGLRDSISEGNLLWSFYLDPSNTPAGIVQLHDKYVINEGQVSITIPT